MSNIRIKNNFAFFSAENLKFFRQYNFNFQPDKTQTTNKLVGKFTRLKILFASDKIISQKKPADKSVVRQWGHLALQITEEVTRGAMSVPEIERAFQEAFQRATPEERELLDVYRPQS